MDDRPKIGLFAGGIEQYWTECGMDDLPRALMGDIQKLKNRLEKKCDVVYPLLDETSWILTKSG